MKRKISHAMILMVMMAFFAILIIPFGCGGGGGNGGGGSGGTATGTVTGTVLDQNSNPVAGATCSIDTGATDTREVYSDETDANGIFAILNVPQGSWQMTISKSGYQTNTVNVTVNEGQTTEIPTNETVITPGTPTPTPTPTASPTTSPTPTPTTTTTPTPTPSPTGGGGGGGGGATPFTTWELQNPLIQGDYQIRDYFVAGVIHVFVGQNGMIYRSADNGATWTKLDSGVNEDLNSVWASADAASWFAVGDTAGVRGTVLYSADSGVTWTAQTHAAIPNVNLNGVFGATDGSKVFIVGNVNVNGTILYSVSGNGSDWVPQTAAQTGTTNLNDIWSSNDGSHVYAVGDESGGPGRLLQSVDLGTTWTQCVLSAGPGNPLPNANLNAVYGDGANDNRIFAVGSGGTVVYGPAGLQNDWVDRTGGAVPAVELNSVFVFSGAGGDVFACGALSGGNGAVVFSAAGDGTDFANQTAAQTGQQALNTVFGAGNIFCAGGNGGGKDNLNGILIGSPDAGTTWTQNIAQVNHAWTQLNGVSAASATNAIAVGERIGAGNGVALHTVNGGQTWTLVDSLVAQALNSVWYRVAGTDAYAVGDAGTSIRWQGAAWADNNSAGLGGHNYFGIHGFDANEYYAAGWDGAANGRVARNNGAGWTAINVGGNQLNDVHTSTVGLTRMIRTVGENASIFSYDSANPWATGSWTNIAAGVTGTDHLKSLWTYGNEIYVVGDDAGGNGVFYVSLLNGNSWTRITAPFAGNPLKSIWGNADRSGIYVVGENSTMYFYNPADALWTDLNSGDTVTIKDLRGIGGFSDLANETYFIVGEGETILHSVP